MTKSDAWQAMLAKAQHAHTLKLNVLLAHPNRAKHYCVDACGLYLDYSKNLIDDEGLDVLWALTKKAKLSKHIRAFFQGRHLNHTEQRGVGHIALRALSSTSFSVQGTDVMPEVRKQLSKLRQFVGDLHAQRWRGYTGKPIKHVVNIGIGGSDLGPKMVATALRPYARHTMSVHYVSNVDPANLYDVLSHCAADETLFIICSKSFGTAETLSNAKLAREWFIQQGGSTQVLHKHFVAITTNHAEANRFGVHPDQQFAMWDWVGGRFSLWSPIGLSVAIMVGMDTFVRLLKGAEAMDEHFKTAPVHQNMPVLLAMLGIWYANGMGAQTHMVVPYDYSLRYFTEHLQQLDMESNGKCVNRKGKPAKYDTSPVIWGTSGTNGQHAYFQLLHQGERLIPSDFILVKNSHYAADYSQKQLLASGIAQMEALMNGRTEEEAGQVMQAEQMGEDEIQALLPYRTFPGNQPSNAIVMDMLTPETLGSLIALYEHKVFVQGVLWDLNSFDQWGVELGKELANNILNELDEDLYQSAEHDASTQALIDRLLK